MIEVERMHAVPNRTSKGVMSLRQHFNAFLQENKVNFKPILRAGAILAELDHASRHDQATAAAIAKRFFAVHASHYSQRTIRISPTFWKGGIKLVLKR